MYHATSGVKNYPNTDGYHLVQLACSRDLKTWHRLGNRSPFIGPSPLSSGAYDLAQIIGSSNVILRDDELWFYYTGLKYRNTWDYVGEYPDGEHIPVTGFDSDIGAINLAVLRRDGFISLNANHQEGRFQTCPFLLVGGKIFVNLNAGHGQLRAEVIDPDGNALMKSYLINEDSTSVAVKWKSGDLSGLRGKMISLRFSLQQAEFYAYWLDA